MMKCKQQEVMLSPYHRILLHEQQLIPARYDYNITFVQRITGKLALHRLQAAVNKFTDNTFLYRCVVGETQRHPIWIDTGSSPELETFATCDEEAVDRFVKKPFYLTKEPASRFGLFKIDENTALFTMVIHHILLDGLKFDQLISTLSQLYNHLDAVTFDSLASQQQCLIDANAELAQFDQDGVKSFWRERFHHAPKPQAIMGDREGEANQSENSVNFTLPKTDYYAWKSHLQDDVSDFVIMLTVFGVLVSKYQQNTEALVSYPVSVKKTDNLSVGSTINTVITHFGPQKAQTFSELLSIKKSEVKAELSHCALPLYEMAELLNDNSPRLCFAQTNLKLRALEFQDCTCQVVKTHYYDLAGNDIVLEYDFSDAVNINFRVKHNAKYSKTFINAFFQHFQNLLSNCLTLVDEPIDNLKWMSDEEIDKVIKQFNPPNFQVHQDDTLSRVFERIADRVPDNVACSFSGEQLTYRELNTKANQLGNLILDKISEANVQTSTNNPVIGIYLPRSTKLIISMLAIVKTGSAYLPIDTALPEERVRFLLADSGCQCVLTDNAAYPALSEIVDDKRIITVDDNDTLQPMSCDNPSPPICSDDLAYIMYTSGTTGLPKGVLVEHAGVLRLALDKRHMNISEEDCFLQASNISFDAATFEIWGALLNGAKLQLLEDHLVLGNAKSFAAYLSANNITVLWLTVGLFNQLAAQDNTVFASLNTLIIGGDALSKPVIESLVDLPASQKPKTLFNGYGPTENTTFTTLYAISQPQKHLKSIPIGQPLSGTVCYILDHRMQPVPIGVVGDLYVGGQGLARGYLNKPDLTSASFISNPFRQNSDTETSYATRIYKTGDLARWLDDGNIEYIGRNDNQVKIRGFRIELREVETCIMQFGGMSQCAVLIAPECNEGNANQSGNKQLIAYYTQMTANSVSKQDLRDYLAKYLPDYMVPNYFVEVEQFPLTKNGKLDVNELHTHFLAATTYETRTEQLDEYESIIKEIFQEVLGQSEISLFTHVLDLGGHSLQVLRMAAKIQQIFEIPCSVATIMEKGTIKQVAAYVKHQHRHDQSHYAPICATPQQNRYPLSYEQQRLWFLSKFTGQNAIYNIVTAFKIGGELDTRVLEKALSLVLNRHKIFQTRYADDTQGTPFQFIATGAIETHFTVHPDVLEEDKILPVLKSSALMEYDLRKEGAYAFELYPLTSKDAYLFIANVHHMLTDAWSLNVFFKELSITYNALRLGLKPELPANAIQYYDYAVWQESNANAQKWDQELAYWKKQLVNTVNIDLPLKKSRPPVSTYNGAHLKFNLDANLVTDITDFVSQHDSTLHMFFMSVYYHLLHTYSGQKDFVIGIPVSNREQVQLENVCGFFVNMLPIRITENPQTKSALLQQVKTVCMDAYKNQSIPFVHLVNQLQLGRDQSTPPLFQVMFNLLHDADDKLTLSEARTERIHFDANVSKFDLSLVIQVSTDGITCCFEYNTDLFAVDLIDRMASQFQHLASDFVNNVEGKLSTSHRLTTDGLHKMLVEFNDTHSEQGSDTTVTQLFENKASQHPQATAIQHGSERISYERLNKQADDLAQRLHHKYTELSGTALTRDDIIAIYMERSIDLAIALLGIHKAGCAFVPIDTRLPAERVHFILHDTQARLVLTDDHHIIQLQDIGVNDVELIQLKANTVQQTQPLPDYRPTDLAYVMYTSGSTGKPKGVCINHSSLSNLITNFSEILPLEYGKKFVSLTAYSFDIFYLEFFGSVCFGVELVLPKRDILEDVGRLSDFINHSDADLIQATPTLWQLIIDQLQPSTKLTALCGGEPLHPSLRDRLLRVANTLWNVYGPTETTIWSTAKQLTLEDKLSIGRPINNTTIYILDEMHRPLPIGMRGELYIGGAGLAREYLNNPELTAERFIKKPAHLCVSDVNHHDPYLYKTGDYGRWLENGEIELLGRMDFQIKLRGHRVELAEIELQLLTHEAVSVCAVVVYGSESEPSQTVIAYYTATQSLNSADLKQFMMDKLPSYMVPDLFHQVEELPLTNNGKIDRSALAERPIAPTIVAAQDLPQTEIEVTLASLFCDLLNRDEVGRNENFFDIGGHSMNAMQLLTRINKLFSADISLKTLFTLATIAELSRHIETQVNVEIF